MFCYKSDGDGMKISQNNNQAYCYQVRWVQELGNIEITKKQVACDKKENITMAVWLMKEYRQ